MYITSLRPSEEQIVMTSVNDMTEAKATTIPIILKCAGVLPYAFKENNALMILLGQEDESPEWVDSKKWSDFCGGPKPGESHEQSAAREWWEETMGMYGSEAVYLDMVKRSGIKVMPAPDVVIFLVQVPYEPLVVATYNNIYSCIAGCKVAHPKWKGARYLPSCPEGYGEKTSLMWMRYDAVVADIEPVYRASFRTSLLSVPMKAAIATLSR